MALRRILRGASTLGYALLLACVLPGLWVLLGEPGWPLYFAALRLHVLAGQGLAIAALPALLAHLWLTGSRPFLGLVVVALPLAGLWWVFERGDGLRWMLDGYLHRGLSAVEASGLSVLALLAVAAAVQVLPRLERPQKTRLSGLLLALAIGPAIALGWSGSQIRGDARWGALIGHSALGLAATALIVPHYRAVRRRWPGRRGAAITVLAAAALTAFWGVWIDRTYFAFFTAEGAEARWVTAALSPTAVPEHRLPVPLVAASAGCGASGCHAELTEQWAGSAHRFAASNALYVAAVNGLVADRGPAAALACALCHDPDRAMAGQVEAAYAEGAPGDGDGVSCLACHAAYDADAPVGDGRVKFRLPRPYGGEGDVERRRILADPRLHRGNFQASEHLMSDEGCGVCHRASHPLADGVALLQNPYRAEGDPGVDPDAERVSCGLCHMPTTTPQSGGRMPLYEHRWPGLNVDLAAYVPAGSEQAVEAGRQATQRFVDGGLDASHLPDALDDNPEFAAYARAAAGRGLLEVDASARWTADGLTVVVDATNRRAAHPLPIGPFDLNEVWLEVLVQEAAGGKVLAHVGAIVDGAVDPRAPRLGARMLDVQGDPLREHRLDRLAAVAERRQIGPGETHRETLRLAIDAAGADNLLVSAAWRFRRVNPAFAAFALGSGAIDRFAVLTLGLDSTAVAPP